MYTGQDEISFLPRWRGIQGVSFLAPLEWDMKTAVVFLKMYPKKTEGPPCPASGASGGDNLP